MKHIKGSWRWGQQKRSEESDLLAEADLLLSGRMMNVYAQRLRRVPAWLLVNTLAHADMATLQQVTTNRAITEAGNLNTTFQSLAKTLLSVADDDGELMIVQRTALVALELQLLADKIPQPTSPEDLDDLVSERLQEHVMRRRQ